MKTSSIGYLIGEGLRNLKHNRQMTVASIGVLMACMLLIGATILFSMNVNGLMGYVESLNEVVVFVSEGVSQQKIDQLRRNLEADSNITSVSFVSKEQALAEERELLKDAAALLEGLEGDENPLPASFRVRVKRLEDLDATLLRIRAMDGVDYPSAPTDVANTLIDIRSGVNTAGILIVGILTVVSMIIISNTVKMTIYSRSKEISIMKLVGATDGFIRIPFLVEGMSIGLLSAVFSSVLLGIGYHFVMNWLAGANSSWIQFAYAHFIRFADIAPQMVLGFCAAGAVFGFMGSVLFVGKYLDV